MDTFDDLLSDKIQNDKIDFDIDNSTLNHLHNMVNLNSTRSNIKKNSIFSFLSDFFSPRFIAVKVAFICILLIVVITNKDSKRHEAYIFLCDSTLIQNNSFDTLNAYNNQISDSLFR